MCLILDRGLVKINKVSFIGWNIDAAACIAVIQSKCELYQVYISHRYQSGDRKNRRIMTLFYKVIQVPKLWQSLFSTMIKFCPSLPDHYDSALGCHFYKKKG